MMDLFRFLICLCMKIFLIPVFIIICNVAFSQKTKRSNCMCSYTFTLSYPKKVQENKISGPVIVEFDRDSFSNPNVIKEFGHGCDDEAMRAANQIINSSKKCAVKCPDQQCENGKIKQPFTFKIHTGKITHNSPFPTHKHQSSNFNTAKNASCGTSTVPICRIRFLPSFCFSNNLRLRLTSPP